MEPISDVLDYWIDFNNTDVGAVFTDVPNTNTTDGCTAEHYLYANGDNGVEVEHYKIIEGYHIWFDFDYNGTNSNEIIWNFMSKYDINGLR